jgi:hypothetical protein
MNQLMETLFDLLNGPHSSEAERRAIRESEKAVQAVKNRLTLEEFDALWKANTDIDNAGYLDSFALGFRLGVQLTIEGLRPIVE